MQGCGGVEVSHPASRASSPLQLPLREARVSTRADGPAGMITGTLQEPYGISFRVSTPSARETASSPNKLSLRAGTVSVTQFPLQVIDTHILCLVCIIKINTLEIARYPEAL